HQNILFRQMLETVDLPSWVREVMVLGEAGFAANPTLKLIDKQGWTYVFAMARNRKFTKKVSKKGGVGGPVALASGYEYTYPLPNRPE
ncbi:hypothetical protein C2W62_48645, partial [Candidatus Entotheonella serta]